MRAILALSSSLGLTLLLVALPASAGGEALQPRLVIEEGEEGSSLFVETPGEGGEALRHLLRERAENPTPGATGGDPAGLAAFVTWSEGAGEDWFSYSRDQGATWVPARRLSTELRLLDGPARPGAALPSPRAGLAQTETGRLHLVQFRTVGLPEWRAALRAAGAEVFSYLPHNAHIVRMDPSLASRVAALDFVERVEPYHPSYRLEPELRDWLETGGGGELRVRAMTPQWGPEGKARLAAAAESAGARVAAYWPSGHVLELWVTSAQLRLLAGHDDLVWADRWTPKETDMDLVREDAGTNWLETNDGYCGQGVRGEVMDSGIQQDHMDFDGVLMHTVASVASHGTSTYGIVFGNGDRDGDGQAQGTGHMPCQEAQGIFADYDALGDRFVHTEELTQDPYFASFQSNSWGNARTRAYTSVSSEMDDIIWRLDFAITQSQSNAGSQDSRPQAWAKNIISVGGIRHYGTLDTSDDAWAGGASIGPASDGRIKPDVSYWYDGIYTTTTGNSYTSGFGGTSAATPEVAGVLGLMVQMWSENVWGTDPVGSTIFERQPHFGTIKGLLVNNARQYPFSGAGADLTRVHQGWGRPNAQVARERAARSFIVDQDTPLQVGTQALYELEVAQGETELKVTMVYPDPPGTTSSTLHRINDLDLKVTSPSSTVYHGNVGLDASPYSLPGGSPNGVDTVENVFVEDPEPGLWTVEVLAAEINQDAHLDTGVDDAVFALVVTGAAPETGECGNGLREGAEECDGDDLGGAVCSGVGCSGGTLACLGDCTFDTSQCSGCPVCGNGSCDFGEDCADCPADCISDSASTCGNGVCEAADGEDCVTCPDDCNGIQTGSPAGRYCCGGGGGKNPVDCSDSRCATGGNTCLPTPAYLYCCGDEVCEGAEDELSCGLDCAPPAGPGEAAAWPSGMLRVTGYDAGTDTLSLSYGVPCSATNHVIEFGALDAASLSTYDWSGQECGVGATGFHDWSVGGLPESLFFVIVAQDGTSSGSYGTDGAGQERPEDAASLDCPLPQSLGDRCDQ
jgi:hypothetical protein